MLSSKPKLRDLIDKRTLILGDLGSGKTSITVELLEEAVSSGYSDQITAIDMAPSLMVKGRRVGGRLNEYTDMVKEVRYLWDPSIKAPRLTAKNRKELIKAVEWNKARIVPMLEEYLHDPQKILVLNDTSIYLQAKPFQPLFKAIETAKTVVANAYFGKALVEDMGTGVSEVERTGTLILKRIMDNVLYQK